MINIINLSNNSNQVFFFFLFFLFSHLNKIIMEYIKDFLNKQFKINLITEEDKIKLYNSNYNSLHNRHTANKYNSTRSNDPQRILTDLNEKDNNSISSKNNENYPTGNLEINIKQNSLQDDIEYEKITDVNESKMTFKELAIFNGFDVEEHFVETEDGYILTIYKLVISSEVTDSILKEIVKKKQLNVLNKRKPFEGIVNTSNYICFFQHGLLDSSDGWICNLKNKCLPYIMANKGFEVWVGNSRGNKYSKAHKVLNPLDDKDKEKFFDYSFDEMAKYDIIACLTYILNQKNKDLEIISDNVSRNNISSGDSNLDSSILTSSPIDKGKFSYEKVFKDFPIPEKRVFYFGHSQGCASIMASLCLHSQFLNTILKGVILLAPACRIANVDSTLIHILKRFELDKLFHEKKIFEIMPYSKELQSFNIFLNTVCPTMSLSMLEEVSDEECLVNCASRLKIFFSHYPSGSSIRSFLHFRQMMETHKFQSFDFGEAVNSVRYAENKGKVIEYNLEEIKGVPIILCAGGKDKLVTITDVRWLRDTLIKNRKKRRILTNTDSMNDDYGKDDNEVNSDLKSNNNKDNNNIESIGVSNEDKDGSDTNDKDNEAYNKGKIIDNFDCPLFSYYEFEMMGHLSFLLNSDISWFDYVLNDIYSLIKHYR